jgi:hypothetical protein
MVAIQSMTEVADQMERSIAREVLRMRIVEIDFTDGAYYSCKYQVQDNDIDWLKPRTYNLSTFSIPSLKEEITELKNPIRRVFNLGEDKTDDFHPWGDRELRVKKLAIDYAEEGDKGEKSLGVEPKKAGEIKTIAISSEYVSMYVMSKKEEPTISLGTFKQYVTVANAGAAGYLSKDEVIALQNLLNKLAAAIADEINNKTILKAEQLRLF